MTAFLRMILPPLIGALLAFMSVFAFAYFCGPDANADAAAKVGRYDYECDWNIHLDTSLTAPGLERDTQAGAWGDCLTWWRTR